MSKVEIKIKLDPVPVITAICGLASLLAFAISRASVDFNAALYWYRSPNLWLVFSIFCFATGVSGGIYCVIRSAPFYGMARDGGLDLFSGQSRDQFFLEGLIVVCFTLGIALSAVLLHYSTRIPYALVRHVFVLAFMSTFCVLCLQLWNMYADKTPWYSLEETLPENVWQHLQWAVKRFKEESW